MRLDYSVVLSNNRILHKNINQSCRISSHAYFATREELSHSDIIYFDCLQFLIKILMYKIDNCRVYVIQSKKQYPKYVYIFHGVD